MQIPEGFEPVKSGTPFVDLVGPFYFKEESNVVAIGLRLEEKHCNSAGTAHGGLIATMADIALGNSIGHASISDEEREQWRSDGYELKRKGMVGRAITGPTDYEQIPELAERGQARAVEFFEMLNERFAESEYLAGDGFSVADITACVIVQFSGWIKSGPTDAHTNTERWYEVVRTRPSFSS